MLVTNAVTITVSFLIAYTWRFGWQQDEPAFLNVNEATVFAFLVLAYLVVFTVYHPAPVSGRRGLLRLAKETFITNIFMAGVFATLVYATHIGISIPRLFFGYFFTINFLLSFILEAVVMFIERRFVQAHKRKTVVFTDNPDKEAVIRKLTSSGADDFEIIGVAEISEDAGSVYYQHTDGAFVRDESEPIDFLKRHNVDLAIIAVSSIDSERIRMIIDLIGEMGIDSMMTLDSFEVEAFDSRIEDFGQMQVVRFAPRIFTDEELFVKRLIDIIGGVIGSILCVIIGIFIVPAILIEDGRPVIFKQQRVGRNGAYFNMYKFRSMRRDAEQMKDELVELGANEMQGAMFKMKDDPRVTRVGRVLRKFSLDEFPQFFNVLRGEMSLVGTRPPTVDEYDSYSAHHKRRLSLKPGITGLWQTSGRNEITDFEEVVRLDCYYIDHWSVLFDIKILLMTVAAVFRGE